MNIGLAAATGEILVRLDAHSVYPPGYVRRLTAALRDHGADVSGGVCVARARTGTVLGRAIAAAVSNRWVMGNAGYRVGGGDVRVVDTVPFGCWHAETLRRVGGYNEELLRSQDYDLSQRLKKAGARIVLIPNVVIEYYARSGLWENIRYNFYNGYWIGYPMVSAGVRFSARHLVPGAACLLGGLLVAASVVMSSAWPLLLAAPYLIVLVMSGLASAREGLAVAACLPPITVATHVLYGSGTLYGFLKGGLGRLQRRSRRERPAGSAQPGPV
jgi:hypothetical protein